MSIFTLKQNLKILARRASHGCKKPGAQQFLDFLESAANVISA
jgi:hypothetical protein